jgi:hypothetical protein
MFMDYMERTIYKRKTDETNMICQYCLTRLPSCRYGHLRARHYSHKQRCKDKPKEEVQKRLNNDK